jgi:hypothetical protein
MKHSRLLRNGAALALALIVVFALVFAFELAIGLWSAQTAAADAAPPPPTGRVAGSFTPYTELNGVVYTTTGTAYTTARDPNFWYQADAFLTVDVSGTAAVTITPQFSADNTNWADANYVYLSNSSTTAIVTGTAALTATTSSATSVVNTTPYLTLATDNTDYLQFALDGRYLRYKVVAGSFVTTTDRITVTLKTIAKNTQ